MNLIFSSVILLSVMHALIPSHWLPLLTIAKTSHWKNSETLLVTLYMGIAHVLSTIILGSIIAFLGYNYSEKNEALFDIVAPTLLILIGLFFIYRHYKHHHFHISKPVNSKVISRTKIIISLVSLMFLSPCLEVEALFLAASKFGFYQVLSIAIIYSVISITGMLIWVNIALNGLKKLNWHKIEHNAGLITGFVLILCGIFTYFIH